MEIKLRQIFQQKEKSTLIDKLKLRRTIMENKIGSLAEGDGE